MIESSIPPSKERSPPISCYANGVFDSDQTGLRFRSIAVGIVGNLEMTLGWPRCAPAERHLPILVTVASNLQLLVLAVGVALLQCMSPLTLIDFIDEICIFVAVCYSDSALQY